jgi:DNA-binding PadR family transcriptional regulator
MKLPSNTELGLLTALGAQRLTGRQLAARYKEDVGKSISFGSLYTIMSRLREAGWVDQEDSEDEDGRLRYFKLTGKGEKAIAESRDFYGRLLGLVQGGTA